MKFMLVHTPQGKPYYLNMQNVESVSVSDDPNGIVIIVSGITSNKYTATRKDWEAFLRACKAQLLYELA